MICFFCNTTLDKNVHTIQGVNDTLAYYYECNKCKPHRINYREMFNKSTNNLLGEAIRIDEFYIIKSYVRNKTSFNKDIIVNLNDDEQPKLRTYSKQIYEISGIWDIPVNDIKVLKQKLLVYTTFS